MRSKMERMKHSTAASGKRTLALVLGIVMLISAIGAGSVLNVFAEYVRGSEPTDTADAPAPAAAVADTAEADADTAAPDVEEDEILLNNKSDLADTGANADVAQTGGTTWEDSGKDWAFIYSDWNASGQYYSSWYQHSNMSWKSSSSQFEQTFTLRSGYEFHFKIKSGWNSNDGNWYGEDGNGSYIAASASSNAGLKKDGSNIYLYTMNSDSGWVKVSFYAKPGDMRVYVSQSATTAETLKISGNMTDWGNYNNSTTVSMTKDGNGQYSKTFSKLAAKSGTDNDTYRYRFTILKSSDWNRGTTYTSSTTVTTDTPDYIKTYGMLNVDGVCTKFQLTEEADVTITYNVPDNKITINAIPSTTSYYLTGYLNKGTVTTTASTRKFSETSSGSKIYTLTWSPTADHEGYQYVTIYTGSKSYHPVSHPAANGAEATTTKNDPSADNKWKVAAVSGQTVTFTWDMTGTNPTLSWTVSGGSSSSSSWKATKDHKDATPEFTGDAGNYRFVWANNVNGPGTAGTTAIVPKNSGNGYWADLTSYVKSNSNFFFALSDNNSNSGIRGNKNEEIDDTKRSAGTTVTMTNGSGETIFYVEMKERSSVTGNAYFQLIRGVDWTKISAVGVQAYTNSDGHVDYKYFYKEKSSGDDQIATVTVYAKDGAAPINWGNKGSGGASATTGTAYNYAAIATTKITKIGTASQSDNNGTVTVVDCGNASSQYRTASVNVGTAITVTTTIASSYKSKYYVVGWNINGVTYKTDGTPGVNAASNTSTSTGLCTLTYTIPSEPDEDYLEITPIYYLRTNTNCITFYLEGYNTVIDSWGNTPYIYPFYGNLDNVKNSFGVYPGQPMVYTEGKYSTEIPLTDIPISGSTTGTAIKGITINNGYADHVHRNMIYRWTDHDNDADHKQTYDYDDFYKIYNECIKNGQKPNSIIFRIQDESDTYNRSTYGGSKSGLRVIASKDSLSSTDLTNISNGNGWEILTNRYGEPIDLFGTVVSAPTNPTSVGSGNVRVVSTGYNANIAGDYGTAWKIYQYKNSTTYSLVQDPDNDRYAAPPSIFLLRGTASGYDSAVASVGYPEANHSVDGPGSYTDSISQYEGIYKAAKALAGKPVYITYEKDTQDTRKDNSGTGAYRLDGRWYYTHLADQVKSTVGIEYWSNADGDWKKDTVTASSGKGSTSGNTVVFNSDSYASSSNKTTSKTVTITSDTTLNFTATAGTGYLFEGWYIKYSDTSYDKIVGATEAYHIKATANFELVARFVPIVTGSLTIDHTLAASSTGEGTVDMTVNVKNGSKTVETKSGTHVYLEQYISNSYGSYTIEVTLKTKPLYDGKVSAFGYDSFNTSNSITPAIKNASGSTVTLPGAENTETRSVFSFKVSDLYAGSTLATTALKYTSTIDATPHYYNFTYSFASRGSSTNDKSYTSKGEISLKDYKQFFAGDNAQKQAYVKAKAPFESNFLKTMTLDAVVPTYSSSTHTFTSNSSFTTAEGILPTYDVSIKLPYTPYGDSPDSGYKKYNANGDAYTPDAVPFTLKARYDEFVTIDATETTPGAQTKVSKVTDVNDPNHTGNDFITAPDELMNGSTTMYFKCWEIRKLADSDQASAPVVSRVYFPDFNYRIYGDYYVEAIYTDNEDEYWSTVNMEGTNSDIGCSIIYLGDSRNQWNSGTSASSASADVAADKIYNDFIFSYRDKGVELSGDTSGIEVGMILERVIDSSDGTRKWAVGNANVSDMSSYQTTYGTEGNMTAIATALNGNTSLPTGAQKVVWNKSELNNKNFTEQNYAFYSAYGQTVADNTITFAKDNTVDNYVYRAYAYIKGSDGKYYVSEPEYFCMRYTANLNYTE